MAVVGFLRHSSQAALIASLRPVPSVDSLRRGEPSAAAAIDSDPCRLSHQQRKLVLGHVTAVCDAFSAATDVDTSPFYTIFYSSSVPESTLSHYHNTIVARLGLGRPCVSIALVLMQRYWAVVGGARPSKLAVHRLFAAAMLIAMKQYHEQVWCNSTFAPACGLQMTELNRLEVAFLRALDWDVFVSAADVERVVGGLLRVPDGEPAFAALELRTPRRVPRPPPETSPSGGNLMAADLSCTTTASTDTEGSIDRRVLVRGLGRSGVESTYSSSASDAPPPAPTPPPSSDRPASFRRSSSARFVAGRASRTVSVLRDRSSTTQSTADSPS